MLNRPPPYFPQGQLSPPDAKRYRRFKFAVAGLVLGLLIVLGLLGAGVYYLVDWAF